MTVMAGGAGTPAVPMPLTSPAASRVPPYGHVAQPAVATEGGTQARATAVNPAAGESAHPASNDSERASQNARWENLLLRSEGVPPSDEIIQARLAPSSITHYHAPRTHEMHVPTELHRRAEEALRTWLPEYDTRFVPFLRKLCGDLLDPHRDAHPWMATVILAVSRFFPGATLGENDWWILSAVSRVLQEMRNAEMPEGGAHASRTGVSASTSPATSTARAAPTPAGGSVPKRTKIESTSAAPSRPSWKVEVEREEEERRKAREGRQRAWAEGGPSRRREEYRSVVEVSIRPSLGRWFSTTLTDCF